MQSNPLTHSTDGQTASTSQTEVRKTIRLGIETPLHALRASLEEMGKDFPVDAPQIAPLTRALQLIDTVNRNVQVLSAMAAPADFVPLRCTMDELARSAVRGTSATIRDRIFFAVEDPKVFTKVDGPSFSRWLSNLLQASVSRQGEALLRATTREGRAIFSLVSRPNPEQDSRQMELTTPFRREEDELLLQVAESEILRMGGTFERSFSTPGTTRVTASLPLEQPVEGAA